MIAPEDIVAIELRARYGEAVLWQFLLQFPVTPPGLMKLVLFLLQLPKTLPNPEFISLYIATAEGVAAIAPEYHVGS